jgi:DNA-binding GntR family transcriptional regulator
MIVGGDLAPGTRLVNRTLAASLGLSMTPLREAINRLASEGLVTNVPGAGASVRRLDRQELAELYELRLMFEPDAAALAAERALPSDVEELESVCRGWEDIVSRNAAAPLLSAQEFSRWLEGELRFHRILVRSTRNRWLEKWVDQMQLATRVFNAHRGHEDLLSPADARRTIRDKRALVRSIRQRQPEAARRLVRDLILRGQERVLVHYDRENAVERKTK